MITLTKINYIEVMLSLFDFKLSYYP